MDLIEVLCEATKTAAVLHLERFPKVEAREDRGRLITDALKKVLGEEMPGYINGELKAAAESNVGEAWIRRLVNVQCNKWALDALKMVEAEI